MMRLWSLHPEYLDAKGLVALWREGLLAQKVLLGETKGYRHHPQLERFREAKDPIATIGTYLSFVVIEAERRGYNFDGTKIKKKLRVSGKYLKVSQGQLEFEFIHLKGKLKMRDVSRYEQVKGMKKIRPFPGFSVGPGGKALWERA